MSKKCTCGTWNNDSAKFCRNCGKQIPTSDTFTPTNTTKTTTTPTNTKKNSGGDPDNVFLGIIGVIAIIAGLTLFFMDIISKPLAMGIALGGIGCLKGFKS